MNILKFFIFAILILLLVSCSDKGNPIGSFGVNEFFGGHNTERTYIETEKWFQINSDQPFFEVPQDLLQKVSLSDQQIKSGICKIKNYKETIGPIHDSYFTSWKLTSSPNDYIQSVSYGTYYNLEKELKAVQSGEIYIESDYQLGPEIYKKSEEGLLTVTLPDLQQQFPSVIYYKNSLELNDSWVRYKFIDTTTATSIIETFATVIGQEDISLIAGSFSAYKIKLTTYHYDPNYIIENGYEYFVPYVGLVLKESDNIISQWRSDSNETITFRRMIRNELVEYNFVIE